MSVALLGLAAALANAAGQLMSKDFTRRYPARQMIGPLYLLNCALVLPFAPFVPWTWSPEIVGLHGLAIAAMILTALSAWDLLAHGEASAQLTAVALAPLPAVVLTGLLLPGSLDPAQVVAAAVVVVGVTLALRDAFGSLGRAGSIIRILGVAFGTAALTMTAKLLADRGVGVVETYVVRTAAAGLLFTVLIRPRDVDFRELPRMVVRAVAITTYFLLVIVAVGQGSPAVVQTMVATAPLWALAYEWGREGRRPRTPALAAVALVAIGVAITFLA
jgi:drug/metabolite transporter (DMT)-like permease